jgi:hypothetical protein
MERTFAVRTVSFVLFCAVLSVIAAVCPVINCSAQGTSVPIKISEPYRETFRSIEMPENVSVAAPVFTNLAPLQDTGGKQRDRNFADRKNDVNNGTAPLSAGSRPERNKEESRGESKTSPPVFPSIPASLGTPNSIAGAGTAPVFQPDTSVKFTKPVDDRKGFSLDGSLTGAESGTKPLSNSRSTSQNTFRNTPSIAATLQDVFNTPPPLPQGTVDSAVIPKMLLPAEDGNKESTGRVNTAVKKSDTKKEEEKAAGTKVNGTLLVATVLLVMTLVFVVITAADYHHRWVQSLTTLNKQYTIPLLDDGWEQTGPGDVSVYATGAAYQSDDLPSGFAYNTHNASYRSPV